MSERIEIKALKNGPYLIAAGAIFTDAEGNEKAVDGKMVALCRCGLSANKPFCDGTHQKNNFQGDAATVSLPVVGK